MGILCFYYIDSSDLLGPAAVSWLIDVHCHLFMGCTVMSDCGSGNERLPPMMPDIIDCADGMRQIIIYTFDHAFNQLIGMELKLIYFDSHSLCFDQFKHYLNHCNK